MGLPQKLEKTLKPSGLGPRCICDLIVISTFIPAEVRKTTTTAPVGNCWYFETL